MLSRFRWRTPVYQNTGSVARDHLASERTFLAWIRTGLGFVALGIAIERFSQLDLRELLEPLRSPAPPAADSGTDRAAAPRHQPQSNEEDEARSRDLEKRHSRVLVGTLLALGGGSIAYGATRYFSNLRLLERGQFKPAYHGAAVVAAAVAGLAGGVYGESIRRRWEERREEDLR
ncbi:hypothetical protein NKR23_g624 [Pleurostoma richardsiae]|uniref:DUF202 domain-containing protein n=1 Tax=Pleurostoma richardsiae TaxID=41990 RepID=A0AA38S7C8_9PEZI|nr:hypothetical protein NKR23_g624 [Pleurostoma richardsiae]